MHRLPCMPSKHNGCAIITWIFFSPLFLKVALEWWLRIISTSYLLRAVLHYTYCIPYITVPWNPNQTPCIKRPSLDVKSRLGFIKTYADKAAFRPGKRGKKIRWPTARHNYWRLVSIFCVAILMISEWGLLSGVCRTKGLIECEGRIELVHIV